MASDLDAETLPFFARQIIAMAKGQTFFDGEIVIRTRQGERIHVWMTLTLPSTEEPGFALVTLNDISERKRHTAERDQLVVNWEPRFSHAMSSCPSHRMS